MGDKTFRQKPLQSSSY